MADDYDVNSPLRDTPPARDVVFARPLRVMDSTKLAGKEFVDANGQIVPHERVLVALNAPTPDAARVIEVMRKALRDARHCLGNIQANDEGEIELYGGFVSGPLLASIDAALTAAPEGQGTEVVDAILADYDRVMASIGGCTDGSCVIVKPKGMHTNGGCRCSNDQTKARRAMQAAANMRHRLCAALLQSPRGNKP